MLRKITASFIFVFIILFGYQMARTNSGGPPGNNLTGAPGEGNCTSCHNTFALNSGTATRTLVLNNDPTITSYTPGQTYTVTYTISAVAQLYGFQATVKRANGTAAGALINTNPNQTSLSGNYISHNSGGTAPTTTNQRVYSWSWTAPAAGAGTATFYVAANAADGNSGTSGDRIYTNSFAFAEGVAAPSIAAATFTPTAVCTGSQLTVNFTITGTFNSGNVFTAELSSPSGSFASPTSIGTITSTTAGAISATIPTTAVAGVGYRIRIVSSNPVSTGASSTVFSISVPAAAPTLTFDGRTISASGSGTYTWFRDGNTIAGATTSTFVPTQAGSYTAGISNTGCSPSISQAVNVTAGFASIAAPAAQYCAGSSTQIGFTTFGTFGGGNSFSAELINAQNQVTPLTVTGQTASTVNVQLPNTAGTGFKIRVKSSTPVAMTAESAAFALIAAPAEPSISQTGFVLSSSATTGNSWFKDGVVIPNATGQTYTVTQNGNYYVNVTQSGCVSPNSDTISINNVSVAEEELNAARIYPNPAVGSFVIESSNSVLVELVDLQGRTLKTLTVESGKSIVPLDGISAGLYLVRLQQGTAQRQLRLVVE